MKTTIQIFENSEFGQVRTMTNAEGEPLFCGKDIAEALGYNNPPKAIRDHVEEDDRTKRSLIDSLGREQQSFFINESGLYALILAEGVTERTVPLRQGDERSEAEQTERRGYDNNSFPTDYNGIEYSEIIRRLAESPAKSQREMLHSPDGSLFEAPPPHYVLVPLPGGQC